MYSFVHFFLLEQQNNKLYTGQTNQLVHCVVCINSKIISDDNKLFLYIFYYIWILRLLAFSIELKPQTANSALYWLKKVFVALLIDFVIYFRIHLCI